MYQPKRVVMLTRPEGSRATSNRPSLDKSTLASLWILHSLTTMFLTAVNKNIFQHNTNCCTVCLIKQQTIIVFTVP